MKHKKMMVVVSMCTDAEVKFMKPFVAGHCPYPTVVKGSIWPTYTPQNPGTFFII